MTGETSPNAHFDPAYYLERYPDVAQAGIDPFLHYMDFGFREGRDPSPGFQTGYYIAKNNMRNIAPTMLHAYLFPTPAPYDPFQWYFAAE